MNKKFELITKAIDQLSEGKIIIVTDDEDRENEGDLLCTIEGATPENINFMIKYGRGLVCAPITTKIAQQLELFPMVNNNLDPFKTNFTVSIDHISTRTGISAFERSTTIQKLIDPLSKATDFNRPGHIFPLIAKDGGVLVRNGHTEAAVDLSRLANKTPGGVICEIVDENGQMMKGEELKNFAKRHQLTIITIADLIEYIKVFHHPLKHFSTANLPTKYGNFKIHAFKNDVNNNEQIALSYGNIENSENLIVRVHSECLTGDTLGSLKCDCGSQLDKALRDIQNAGSGLLIYVKNHEGRGIGIANKVKAYSLQDQGKNTIEANTCLNLPIDARTYDEAAAIIHHFKIQSIVLETNNPLKIEELKKYNVQISSRMSAEVKTNKENYEYLKTKKEQMNHQLKLDEEE